LSAARPVHSRPTFAVSVSAFRAANTPNYTPFQSYVNTFLKIISINHQSTDPPPDALDPRSLSPLDAHAQPF